MIFLINDPKLYMRLRKIAAFCAQTATGSVRIRLQRNACVAHAHFSLVLAGNKHTLAGPQMSMLLNLRRRIYPYFEIEIAMCHCLSEYVYSFCEMDCVGCAGLLSIVGVKRYVLWTVNDYDGTLIF